MHKLTKFSALTLAALIASTSVASAGIFDIPNIVVDKGTKNPPHPTGPKPPHPTTITDLDDALEPFTGPAVRTGPNGPTPKGNPGGGSTTESNDSVEEAAELDCAVPGAEFTTTNDLLIINVGTVDLEPGLKLKFRVRASGDRGAFILPRTIQPGKQLRIPDMLNGAVAGAPCDAQIL